jgi:peptidyl-dipeptidase A
VTLEDLLSVFHQMGHIQYFLQYQNLSVIYQEGASPAFEEAVGSVIALSVSSHKYLLARGLLSQPHQDSGDGRWGGGVSQEGGLSLGLQLGLRGG